jgi:hypothetical protein
LISFGKQSEGLKRTFSIEEVKPGLAKSRSLSQMSPSIPSRAEVKVSSSLSEYFGNVIDDDTQEDDEDDPFFF